MQPGTTQAFRPIQNLRVISCTPSASLALGSVSALLNLPRATLSELLERTPVLLPVPPGQDARRLRGFLMAVGLRVADCHPDTADCLDLCLQPKPGAEVDALVPLLSPVLQTVMPLSDAALRAGLAAPDGLILPLLSAPVAERLSRRLRRLRQVSVLHSRCGESLHDLFAPADGLAGLADHLRLLGYGEDPQTGAVAAGLDRHVAGHLARRFPQARVIDRAFQRFDVLLSRITVPVSEDIADFLTSRCGLGRDRFDLVSPAAPLRLETGLLRASALRFRQDYAAIGLHPVLTLSHPLPV